MKAETKANAAGRVDVAASRIFHTLLAKHGNPVLKVGAAIFSDDIAQCFEKNLGPGTKAHKIGERMLRIVDARQRQRECN